MPTDAAGAFGFELEPGTYGLLFAPPRPFLATELRQLPLGSDRLLPPVILQTGVSASGLVTDSGGTPVEGVGLTFEEAASGLPDAVKALKRILHAADGFLIAAPEYNGGITPLLKNVIDWASRGDESEDPPLNPWRGKTAALFAASVQRACQSPSE